MTEPAESARGRLALAPERLRRRLDPARLGFDSTAEVEPLRETIGQPRALEAIDFALSIGTSGYNAFVSGEQGSGRRSTVREHLERVRGSAPPPHDWLHVHNFSDPDRPSVLRLPAGRGCELQRQMREFVAAAREAIPRAFEGEDYARGRQRALSEVAARRDAVTRDMEAFARERRFMLHSGSGGILPVPLVDGQPLGPEEAERLSEQEREELNRRGQEVEERVGTAVRELRRLEKEAAQRVREHNRETVGSVTAPLLDEMRERHADQPPVLAYLDAVQADLPDRLPDFRPTEEERPQGGPPPRVDGPRRDDPLARYQVNVLVDNSGSEGAPVVFERNPTYYNLIGRVDYRSTFGTMLTDFRGVKAGALHRANGGYLVLDAAEVLVQPFAWHALKRALRARELRIENLSEQFSAVPIATLRPEPVPLDVKVILIGPPRLYHLLYGLDEDFRELFKVKVEFSPDMEWSDEHVAELAAFVARRVSDEGLRHFDRGAVAAVVEHAARARDHQGRLSACLRDVSDLVSEASFWAGRAGRELVGSEDVEGAIRARTRRSDLLEERVRELIAEGTHMIGVTGSTAGQVNGLGLIELGDHRFARPARVTARVSLGRGSVESIEREIDLSGPIHSKGFLILSGYLAQQYGQERPLAMRATITFEQAYEAVEGDSASLAELCALLSALSGLPAAQGIAVTGSVNQRGEVQAVGGVTRKIEGFFAVCRAGGLTGEQGVVVPAANVRHLMLEEDVVAAVAQGRFHVWGVSHVDEALELLTGRPAGEPGPDGAHPEGSVHRLVADRLGVYAQRLRDFAASGAAQALPQAAEPE